MKKNTFKTLFLSFLGIIRTASNIDKTADHFSEDILLATAV